MVEQFRMSSTMNCLLTTHCYRRNSSPESSPHTLETVLAPTVWICLPLPRKRMNTPHRDRILVLEEVNSCNHKPDVATDLPWLVPWIPPALGTQCQGHSSLCEYASEAMSTLGCRCLTYPWGLSGLPFLPNKLRALVAKWRGS